MARLVIGGLVATGVSVRAAFAGRARGPRIVALVASLMLLAVSGAGAGRDDTTPLLMVVTGGGTLEPSRGLSLRCASTCYGRRTISVDGRVTLRATPAPGWRLLSWFGACAGNSPTCTLRLTKPASASVVFAPKSAIPLGTRIPAVTQFPVWHEDLAAGPDGNLWFVLCCKSHTEDARIGRMTPGGKVTLFELPDPGGSHSPRNPQSLVAGPAGDMWFTLRYAHKLGRITPSGAVTYFPIPGEATGPDALTLGADGGLWFTESRTTFRPLIGLGGGSVEPDTTVYSIGRMSTSGEVRRFRLPTPGVGATSIAAGPDGNVWFAEPAARKLGRITPEGEISEFPLPPGPNRPDSLVAGPDGNVWFTLRYAGVAQTRPAVDRARNWIGRITPAGRIRLFALPNTPRGVWRSTPFGILVGPDRNLWFWREDEIGRITPAGKITLFDVPAHPQLGAHGLVAGPNGSLWLSRMRAIAEIPLAS